MISCVKDKVCMQIYDDENKDFKPFATNSLFWVSFWILYHVEPRTLQNAYRKMLPNVIQQMLFKFVQEII